MQRHLLAFYKVVEQHDNAAPLSFQVFLFHDMCHSTVMERTKLQLGQALVKSCLKQLSHRQSLLDYL